MTIRSLFTAAALACTVLTPALAQPAASADALGRQAAIPAPADTPWPGGTIMLDIDATDVARGIYRVTQTIPLAAGTSRLTLLLPEWLPGNHAPRGPIAELAGLEFAADGKPVSWQRDLVDVHAFHIDLPQGARAVTARFVHTSPLRSSEGRVTMTPAMLNLQWEKMSLYPAGHFVSKIAVKPSVTLPNGWLAATALPGRTRSGDRVEWSATDYETLVDSPIFAGIYNRQWELGHNVRLNAVADASTQLALDAKNLAKLNKLTDEALLVFGAPPFDRYEFLVALSDKIGGIGLEHMASSENQLEPRNFKDWDEFDWDRNVLAHEFTHAWNGKYRRPARLWTPDYRTPMQDDLLWVYEGQTQFWGWVLSARSGTQSKDIVLGMIAMSAANLGESPGRKWRSVEDTTLDPIIAARKAKPYASLTRGEDYYNEGALVWLEADQVIRAGTGGRRGLDDFARAFFAHRADGPHINTYERDDVIAALNAIYPYDWTSFFRDRIDRPDAPAPYKGIEMAGYKLVWKDKPNPYAEAWMKHQRNLTLGDSLGFTVADDGDVTQPRWDSPAFKAGIVTGSTIVAVDKQAYSADGIKQAITRAATDRKPIELIVKRGTRYDTISVPYYGGLRWPWIEKANSQAIAPLDRLLAPRSGQTAD